MVRRSEQPRCDGCGVIAPRCICARLPRVALPFRLVVVQHGKERAKPTNTARLLPRVVERCTIVTYATHLRPWSPALLDEGRDASRDGGARDERRLLLYPDADATPLDRATAASWAHSPHCLVVLDGTWRQAGRLARKAEGLRELPRVALPPGAPSRWTVRRAPRPEAVATFDAIVRVAELLPDRGTAAALARAWELLLDAQLAHGGSSPSALPARA
jgi:DTW domain-containing protein YfiP